jgi:hypothetical protein
MMCQLKDAGSNPVRGFLSMFTLLQNHDNNDGVVQSGDFLIFEDEVIPNRNRQVYYFDSKDEMEVMDDFAGFISRSVTANLKGTFTLVRWIDPLKILKIREVVIR